MLGARGGGGLRPSVHVQVFSSAKRQSAQVLVDLGVWNPPQTARSRFQPSPVALPEDHNT